MRRGLCIFKVAKALWFYKSPVFLLNAVEHQQEGPFLSSAHTLFQVALFLLVG